MAEADVHNFSSSPHRLPTLSASQALQNLSSTPQRPLSTGLRGLDTILQGSNLTGSDDGPQGGIRRGDITEVYGPPGVGKTTLALEVTANALRLGSSVVWVDTASDLVADRLKNILTKCSVEKGNSGTSSQTTSDSAKQFLSNLHHFVTPTLPHLLTLLAHPSDHFPPEDTSLLVIDNISTLFAQGFPKVANDSRKAQAPPKRSDAAQWVSGRQWAVMGDLISKLGRLAGTRNIAILLLGQTITRVRSDTGAFLHPTASGTAWESGLNCRMVLFQDWLFQSSDASSQPKHMQTVRFAGVLKTKGVTYDGAGRVAAFVIEKDGLHEISLDHTRSTADISPGLASTTLKRKREEIADSESEAEDVGSDQEFGWGAEDETLQPDNLIE